MLHDLPDDALPSSVSDASGLTTIQAPASAPLRLRAAGPEQATAWRFVPAGTKSVTLRTQAAAVIRPRVSGADGEPVRRARIALLPLGCETICPDRLRAFSDAKNETQLTGVRQTSYRMVVWSDSHGPATRLVTAGGDATLALPRGATAAARLVDAERKPVQDSLLEVTFRLPSLHEGIRRARTAAADGSASISGLPIAPVQWSAAATGRARRVGEAQLAPGRTDLGEIVLDLARTVVVSVRAGKTAVASANVVARGIAAKVTDAKGLARFDQLPASDVEFRVTAAAYRPATSVLRSGETTLTIELARGSGVRATLVRESGAAAPDAVDVRITNNGVQTMQRNSMAPDFLLTGLAPGSGRLRIFAADAEPYDTGELHIGHDEIADLGVVTLKSGRAIRGTVADENGTPVGAARVRTLRVGGDPPAVADVMGNWIETTSGEDGAFRLGGMTPGAQVVVVDASGFAQTVTPNVLVREESGETDAGVLTLSPGVEVELLCKPVRQCPPEARLLPAGGDFPFLSQSAALEGGRAIFHAVAAGEPLLRLSSRQQVVFEKVVSIFRGKERQTVEVELPSTRVHGDVTIGSELARGGSLLFRRVVRSMGVPILVASTTAEGSTLGTEWVGSIPASSTASVNTGGEFVFDAIEPGQYDATYAVGDGATSPVRVVLSDTPDQTLHVRFDDRVLAGTVVEHDGTPVAASIHVIDGSGTTRGATAGPDGSFRLLGVSTGKAHIVARSGQREAEADVDASDSAAQRLVLRLDKEHQNGVTIIVVDPSGAPATGVLAFALSGEALLPASTDNEGEATFASIDDALPHPVVAQRPGSWAFGIAREGEVSRIVFSTRPAALVIRSAGAAGPLTIVAPNAFPVERVLPMTGVLPHLTAKSTVTISGLPPGTYRIAIANLQQIVTLAAGETKSVTFD